MSDQFFEQPALLCLDAIKAVKKWWSSSLSHRLGKKGKKRSIDIQRCRFNKLCLLYLLMGKIQDELLRNRGKPASAFCDNY